MASESNLSTTFTLVAPGLGHWSKTLPVSFQDFTPREKTSAIELALARAFEWFIDGYMRLRFDPFYARRNLGYEILGSTWRKKKRRAERLNASAINPNVWTGNTEKMATTFSRVSTRAIGGRTKMNIGAKIVIPTPGYINQQRGQVTNRTLRTITRDEARRIADRYFDEIAKILSSYELSSIKTRSGKLKLRFGPGREDSAQFGRTNRQSMIAQRKASLVTHG